MHKNPLERLLQIRRLVRGGGIALGVVTFFSFLPFFDKVALWPGIWAYVLSQLIFFVADKKVLHLESLTNTFSKEDEEELLKDRRLDASFLKKYWHMLYNRYLISCSVGGLVFLCTGVIDLAASIVPVGETFFLHMLFCGALGYLLTQGILSLVYWNTPKPYYEIQRNNHEYSIPNMPGTSAWYCSPLSPLHNRH